MYPRARPEDVRRLREAIGEPTLIIEFDPETCERLGVREAWTVLYLEGKAKIPTWVCDWQNTLDGNLPGLIERVSTYDAARVGGHKVYAAKLERKMQRLRDSKRRGRMDKWRGIADYSRKAFQAYVDGKPSVGAT